MSTDKPDIPKDDDWRHRFVSLDALDTIDPLWADLLSLWESKRNGALLPLWSSFDIYDFKPWLGFIAVNKITREPLDTYTVLWGTGLTELYGEDRTGKTLRNSQVEWCVTLKDMDFWTRVVTEPCIGMSEGNLYWKGRDHVHLSRVFLPFAEDGRNCDRIVSATKRVSSSQTKVRTA